jgi:hypothetical protein
MEDNMKKIIKKVFALLLVFGLLAAPVKPALAFDFGYAADAVEEASGVLTNVFNYFGYDYAEKITDKWAPIVAGFLRGLGMFVNFFNQNSTGSVETGNAF